MSAHRYSLNLTAKAQQDFEDVITYTAATWGDDQAVRYGQSFRVAFDLLLSKPLIGVAQPELGTRLRSRLVEHHNIYYFVREHTLEIVRILHERVDPALHIQP